MEKKHAPKIEIKAKGAISSLRRPSAKKPVAAARNPAATSPRGEAGDAKTILAAELDEAAQRKCKPASRALHSFVRDIANECRTDKGDQKTNIIDQGEKSSFCMDADMIRRLHLHLEECRLEGSTTHFSQRQGIPERPRAGIMIDFDTTHSNARINLAPRVYHRFATALAGRLQKEINFQRSGESEFKTNMFFIVKPSAVSVPPDKAEKPEDKYRFGIHVLVPGIKVERCYKKWAFRKSWKDDGVFDAALKELGAVGDTKRCLDENSATVPVFFFGSCKSGSKPYTLGATFEVTFDAAENGNPIVRELSEKELEGRNLVAEMDLLDEDYENPLVRKFDFEMRARIATAASAYAQRTQDGTIDDDELRGTDDSVSLLTLTDPEARLIHDLLALLSPEYYTDRNKRRDVIFALANTRESYEPLAEWFSQRHAARWNNASSDNGREAFKTLWADARNRAATGSADRPLTARSLHHWAKSCDAARYREIITQSYHSLICKYVFEFEGVLEHYMVANILYSMLGSKFRVDVDPVAAGRPMYVWYEFVVPGQPMRPGEIWKWRREAEPDEIQRYISEKLTNALRDVADELDAKEGGVESESYAKFYKNLKKAFMASRRKMFNDGFKTSVIRQCHSIFRVRGFAESLDKPGNLFGVGNGILKLGPEVELIDRFHEYPVSRHTKTSFTHRFDPLKNHWDRIVADMVEKVIPEPDARDWILFHVASCLSGDPKEGLILLWIGGGANGKTTFLRSFYKALGSYARKLSIGLFTSEREKANQPNSAMMALKGTRFGVVEEMNRGEDLNEARLKEIVNPGEVTGSEKFQKQEEFTITANITLASQYYFRVASQDHGLWRRIRSYQSIIKFSRSPDPSNRLEYLDDQRFVREFPDSVEYQESALSMLVHYYERLQREYGGHLKNMRSPTIERQTAEFRNTQDTLNRFITERIIVSPDYPATYQTSTLGLMYAEWFTKTIDKKHRYVAGETIKDLENSMISKYLKPSPNRTTVLVGCRVLTEIDMSLREGEEFVADVELRGREQPGAPREVEWSPDAPRNPTWWLPGKKTPMPSPGETIETSDEIDKLGGLETEIAGEIEGAHEGETTEREFTCARNRIEDEKKAKIANDALNSFINRLDDGQIDLSEFL